MREILITATVLILCILLLRRIFRGKISSRLQYAIWLLVALRLVIPVSAEFDLGSFSGFRLLDLVEKDESGIGERLEETIRLEEPIQMSVHANSVLFRLFTTGEIRETVESVPDDGPTSVFLAGTLGFSRLDVLWFLWGLGAVVVGVWILAANIIFSRRLRKTRQPFDLPEEVKTAVLENIFRGKDRLPAIYLAEGISSPCLYGFPGREAVYLTTDVIDDTERLRHVITHELVHKKHGDSFWALLRSILVTVYWFHPLVWVAAVCSKRDCELACDEGALLLLGEEERISYGERAGFRFVLYGNDHDRQRKKCERADSVYCQGTEDFLCGGWRRAFSDCGGMSLCLYKGRAVSRDNSGHAGGSYSHGGGYADTAACKHWRHQRLCGGERN